MDRHPGAPQGGHVEYPNGQRWRKGMEEEEEKAKGRCRRKRGRQEKEKQ